MPKCYICNFYDPRRMSLYRVPDRNDEYCNRSALWLKLLEEKAENVHKIRVCSKHFLKSNFNCSLGVADFFVWQCHRPRKNSKPSQVTFYQIKTFLEAFFTL